MRTRRHHLRGFTLIELLIVIAIISLLLAILLPALSGSRKEARRTQCLTQLRELYLAHATYVHTENVFPALNNESDDGAWQYNYLIYDGEDFDNNFGPLVHGEKIIPEMKLLYCPVQTDPHYMLADQENPWPATRLADTRAAYGRRYGVSGKTFSQLKTIAFLSDVMHIPNVIETAHEIGVNAAYTDGHAKWVRDPGIMLDNELGHPFDVMDNPIVKDIWEWMDGAQ